MTTNLELKKSGDSLVRQFLELQVPESILFIYRIVGNLRYPIINPSALDEQINEHQNSKEADEVVSSFLSNALFERDFPLQGARETLEILMDRVQEVIPWGSPLPVPIGRSLDSFGAEVCGQAVEPIRDYCINTRPHIDPYIQRLKQNFCRTRAAGAAIQCTEKISALGPRAIWARFDWIEARALRRYAECVVHRVWNHEDPDGCLDAYNKGLFHSFGRRPPFRSW